MVLWTLFFSVVVLALAVVAGAVVYVIVAALVRGLLSLLGRNPDAAPADDPVPETPAAATSSSMLPPTKPADESPGAVWERIQGASSPSRSRRLPFRR